MSVSVSPSASITGWRIAVVGAVGALAVGIGVAAGAFLLDQRAAGFGSGSAYVPADAPLYVELRVEPSAEQDAALRELLGRFPPIEGVDLEQPIFAQLTEHIDEALQVRGGSISWAEDVEPWFDGRLALAMLEFPSMAVEPPADPMAVPDAPPFLALLGVTDRAAAADAIDRLLAEAGPDAPTFTESDHGGVAVFSAEAGGAYALTDDQLVIGGTADDVGTALDTRASGGGSIADVASITSLTESLPSDWLAFTTYDMTEAMAQAFTSAEGQSPETTAAFQALMEHQSLRGAMALTAGGDRVVLDAATEPPTGPFAVENADRGLADEVPADTLYYSEASNIGASLAAFIESMKQAFAEQPEVAEQIDTAEAALGAEIEELVSWIDDGAVAIGYDGSQPYGGMVIVPTEVAAAERRLDQLATFASLAAVDASSGITVEEREVAGVTVTTIRWEDPNAGSGDMMGAPTSLVVEYAVTDDRALIGVGEVFIQRALELDAASSLASEPRFTDAVAEFGGAENAGVTWLDLAGAREAVESALSALPEWQAFGADYETQVKPWLLPLDRLVSVVRLDGEVLVQRVALLVE